jgi:WD40 repeat protein
MDEALKIRTSYDLAFSPDSQYLAAVGRDIVIWDLNSRTKKLRAHPLAHASSACFSPNGKQLAVKNTSGQIMLISTENGAVVCNFKNRTDGEGSNIEFSACGEFIVDASWDGRIRVRSALSGRIEFLAEFPGEMIRAVHRDVKGGTWVFSHSPKWTSETESRACDYFSIWHWPFTHRSVIPPIQIAFARTSALTPDAARLAVLSGHAPAELAIFDIANDTPSARCSFSCGGTGSALAWSPKADFLGSVQAEKVVVYRAGSLEPFREFVLPYPSDVAFSPDGRLVAVGSWESGFVLPMSRMTSIPA